MQANIDMSANYFYSISRLEIFSAALSVSRLYFTVNMTSEMHFNACQCIARPNTALLDCILCLTQYLYDPGRLVYPWERVSDCEHISVSRAVSEIRPTN